MKMEKEYIYLKTGDILKENDQYQLSPDDEWKDIHPVDFGRKLDVFVFQYNNSLKLRRFVDKEPEEWY